jgi:hypothetical protein
MQSTLVLPVVFHLGASVALRSAKDLQIILAEVQRIYDQAGIQIEPRVVLDTLTSQHLDVYYQPVINNSPGVNGVSRGRNPREVFIRDTVRLQRVDDQRPLKIALPSHLRLDPTDLDSITPTQYHASQARTTAHEMGHQLGLLHRQDITNLEATGTTGWTLNRAEIVTVRRAAVHRFRARPLPGKPQPSRFYLDGMSHGRDR